MLHEWVSERRQRESGAFDMYYTHKNKGHKYRSIVQVTNYIFQGFDKRKMEVDQETNEVREVGVIEKCSKKRKGECSILKKESATEKQKSNNFGKREVKKFLVEGRNNLMNRDFKYKNKDIGMSEEESSQKSKIDSSILEGKPGTKGQIRKFTPKEKYKEEYFLNKLNWCWHHKVQQIVCGLVGNEVRANNGENGGSNEGGRVSGDYKRLIIS
ncbi:uncharacterized protein LOC125861512 [Solanum stenotomum]|uniref:uncharacterized protein LOC125861512 n=1 Tax=Solanum stenotomum TaxID=172797 RepID=UPI0020D0CD22|nr:uncharacterized protein LOC125861512 [Solanum stenotomum]